MIKVSVAYPNDAAARFDMAYYLANHIPMVQQKLGGALRSSDIKSGGKRLVGKWVAGDHLAEMCLQPEKETR